MDEKQRIAVDLIGQAERLGRLMVADMADMAAAALQDKGDVHGARTLAEFARFVRTAKEPARSN